jgi:hypothetical protein
MDTAKIKKIKDQLEPLLEKAKAEAKANGVDVESGVFFSKIEDIRTRILRKMRITLREYEKVDEMMTREKDDVEAIDIRDDVLAAMRDITVEKNALDVPKELMGIKIRLSKEEGKVTRWDEVSGKPELLTQDKIKGLRPDQINHKDGDHEGIMGRIKQAFKDLESLADTIDNVAQTLREEFLKALDNLKIRHKDLIGTGPDDHHKEKHDLESHSTSDLMEKLLKLINGDFVDDLHRHKIEMPIQSAGVGGTTIGDVMNSFVQNELLGTGDDSETEFTLDYEPYDTAKIEIFVGPGKLYIDEEDGFSVSGLTNQTITMKLAPPSGYKIYANYWRR